MSQPDMFTDPEHRSPWISAYLSGRNILEYVLIAAVMIMVILIGYQVFARYLFNAPSVLTETMLRYMFIWVGLLGAGLCFLDGRHLNLPILLEMLPERRAARLRALIAFMTLGFGAGLTYSGYLFVTRNLVMRVPILDIPVGYLQSVLLICGLLIVLSQIHALSTSLSSGELTATDFAIAVVVLAGATALIWGLSQSSAWQHLQSSAPQVLAVIVLFGSFALFLILGVPIAMALALSGVLTLTLQLSLPRMAPTIGGRLFSGLDNFGFLALPFFVLAGNIMNQSGIARRLVDFAMLVGRRIPGNLWQTNVISNVLFGCLSGSGIATATAVGGIIAPIAREKNYEPAIGTAINAASAPAGMLIPPSGPVIIYSLITGGSASIVALFLAGYLPGLIMAAAVMISAFVYARRLGYSADRSKLGWSETGKVFFRAIPSLLMVIAVIGGITGGVFTAVEGSGIAAIYSLLLATCYRSITPAKLIEAVRDTVFTTGIIAFLIACSGLMSWSMTFAGIPATVGEMLTAISDNRFVILLIINLTLLIVGVFMDMTPALLIFTPIFYPVVTELGVDPVHFGMIIIYNLSMGVVTPPVGTVLFVACGVSGEPLARVIRPLLPIFGLQILGLLLVTFVPAFSLFLPNLFGV